MRMQGDSRLFFEAQQDIGFSWEQQTKHLSIPVFVDFRRVDRILLPSLNPFSPGAARIPGGVELKSLKRAGQAQTKLEDLCFWMPCCPRLVGLFTDLSEAAHPQKAGGTSRGHQ